MINPLAYTTKDYGTTIMIFDKDKVIIKKYDSIVQVIEIEHLWDFLQFNLATMPDTENPGLSRRKREAVTGLTKGE